MNPEDDKLAGLIGRLNGLRDRAEALPEDAPNLDLLADFADVAAELSNEYRLECRRLSTEVQELRAALTGLLDVLEPRDVLPPEYQSFLRSVDVAKDRARAALKPETVK